MCRIMVNGSHNAVRKIRFLQVSNALCRQLQGKHTGSIAEMGCFRGFDNGGSFLSIPPEIEHLDRAN